MFKDIEKKTDPKEIYFYKDLLMNSRDNRNMDVVTVSSTSDMLEEKEPRFNK